ncbi:hypothetical protein BGY98DRAFT_1183486 [Russula aff. rugulosa BPL654]|nr:hypothetical protein BGY98DRAFT_1183486 [Russula aff. rugulosa BPL654]
MFTSRLVSFAVISTLVSSAQPQASRFSVRVGPRFGGVLANSENTIVWTCHTDVPASTNGDYQLLVNNTNPLILTSAEAIVADVPNADCSHTITTQQAALTAATGYTLILADPIDQTKIYAVSQPFEIKALGATYPPSSATPLESSTASQTGASSTGSATGSSSSATSTPKSNGAFASFKVPAAEYVCIGTETLCTAHVFCFDIFGPGSLRTAF